MNERIEKLGEQADLLGECTPTKIPGRYVGYITEEQILKFAELIVRECIQVCKSRVGNNDYNTGRMHCVSDLKEHFGVEE
jgi:hypothetical protein